MARPSGKADVAAQRGAIRSAVTTLTGAELVKSKQRVAESRFLEPACGSGNFLIQVLRRKLASVELKFGKSDFEKRPLRPARADVHLRHRALGRQHRRVPRQPSRNLRRVPQPRRFRDLYRAAAYVLSQNLVHGDALTMLTNTGTPIVCAEWGYLGKGKFQRRDFRFDALTQSAAFRAAERCCHRG